MLRNLRLRPEAFAALDVPLDVRAGVIGTLALKVPWSRLGREPIVLSLDRVYLLAAPAQGVAVPLTGEEQVRFTCTAHTPLHLRCL